MKRFWNGLFSLFLIVSLIGTSLPVFAQSPRKASAEYDPAPNPQDPMGRELIDLLASIPDAPGVSQEFTGSQKFRPHFGPVLWRMLQQKNSMKILFIGQDATHIAEAANRTATAGFGGRAQDLANYFGVDRGAGFINTYAFTIKGQYGAFNTPFLQSGKDGEVVRQAGFVDNHLWLMTHDPESPVAQFRNKLIDWIIRNNRESLQMIVLFGGAARDAAATFIESKGGKVGSRWDAEQMKFIQVPEIDIVHAGANNEFPVPFTKEGKDVYAEMLGRRLDYSKPADQAAVQELIKTRGAELARKMAFSKAGPFGNGMIHPAQLGGYDLDEIEVNGRKTRSLKGLPLSDKTQIQKDLVVLELPHPSALSRLTPQQASERVGNALKVLEPYVRDGWKIPADKGFENQFAAGKSYRYARAEIGPEYYDFGAPASRMVPVSSASRMSGKPHVIVFGTRDRAPFDKEALDAATFAKPSEAKDPRQMFTGRPRTEDSRYIFDPGPGETYAKMMKENLDLETIFKAKKGMSWKENGIDAYNIKTHPDVRDFGHYRGTFKRPRVLILADPDGFDDLITSRALTGARGQYLNGLMRDLGVGDEYLVLKSVPFGMDGATVSEWETVLSQTKAYREKLVRSVLAEGSVELILTDGDMAAKEMSRILGGTDDAAFVKIRREGLANNSGIREAGEEILRTGRFRASRITGERVDIPRSHLVFYSRIWEGTSGDRVLNSTGKDRGLAFAEIAPKWAWSQKPQLFEDAAKVQVLKAKIRDNGLREAGESVPDYLQRTDRLRVPEIPRRLMREEIRGLPGAPACSRVFAA